MGYWIYQRKTRFIMRKEHHEAALGAIKSLSSRLRVVGDRAFHFAYVSTEEFANAQNLKAALMAWRWKPKFSPEDGSIVGISFMRDKLGDEATLFAAIAPYVEAGSYIEMGGDDGQFWRWVFDGQYVYEVRGRLRFEKPTDANRMDPNRVHASGWSKITDIDGSDELETQ
jgi:hypothetical protein